MGFQFIRAVFFAAYTRVRPPFSSKLLDADIAVDM